ncbi:MAG: multifunctional CCA addition/repair protein [Oceanococcus sp.]
MNPALCTPPANVPGQCYLVGGAVRDSLLELEVKERDWVVIGSTPQAMLDAGFRPVGKDFPVFLHPQSQEEFALARTERKSGHGYAGFTVYADPSVTLEQDLERRDLSINAIAMDNQGQLIDPWGGLADIQQGRLRAVSAHFEEDPLRVLRLARFLARFFSLGFRPDDGTRALLTRMAASGELDHLTPERLWRETEKALLSDHPAEYFRLLREIDALKILFPELDRLFGKPQTAKYHPEIDSGVHALMAIAQSALINDDLETRFAVLCHDFGKGVTPENILPSHRGHEHRGVPLIEAFCQRLRVPKALKQSALVVAEYHLLCHQARELRPATLLKLMHNLDAFRRPQRMEIFLNACLADARGREGFETTPYPQAEFLRQAFAAANAVTTKNLIAQGISGVALGEALQVAREQALQAFKQQQSA